MRPPLSWKVLRVDDFGAGPHRSASDNSAAFEAAVDEAMLLGCSHDKSGAALLFSPGTYYFDRTLDISMALEVSSKGSILERGHNTWLVGDQTVLCFTPGADYRDAPAVRFAAASEINESTYYTLS
jgi:hypothetical protein